MPAKHFSPNVFTTVRSYSFLFEIIDSSVCQVTFWNRWKNTRRLSSCNTSWHATVNEECFQMSISPVKSVLVAVKKSNGGRATCCWQDCSITLWKKILKCCVMFSNMYLCKWRFASRATSSRKDAAHVNSDCNTSIFWMFSETLMMDNVKLCVIYSRVRLGFDCSFTSQTNIYAVNSSRTELPSFTLG